MTVPSVKPLALMPLTVQEPPLTVVVCTVVEWLAVSVITNEIASPLSPVPATVALPTLAMLTFGVLVNATAGATAIFAFD